MNPNSTNIHDLPLDGANNVVQQHPQQGSGLPEGLDQSTISMLISGIQQASSSGGTQLNSRDIPQQQQTIVPETVANYIPQQQQHQKEVTFAEEDQIESYANKIESENRYDAFYQDLQRPLFLTILYFLFQLPFIKQHLFRYLPILFFTHQESIQMKQLNVNLYGHIALCIVYGTLCYFFLKYSTF